ncbi:MAG: NERD domain-containing protein, partial [Rhizonema sp. PD37]|nr:NERD domain-containing protein [Rhizonema sp. PD37]
MSLLKSSGDIDMVSSLKVNIVARRIGRFALTGMITCLIGSVAIFEGYKNYWNKTIFRVQTVDFNLLSHTLPTKLSYTIIQNKPEELQRTLDSNYSLFGLIITDSSGQKVIAWSGKKLNHSSWEIALNPKKLQSYPYDVLLDPPPLFSQWNYSDSHAVERTATNFTNKGRVIGRVYYVRGIIPSFRDDFWKWLSNPISESSRFKAYAGSLVACFAAGIAFWSICEYILYTKRVQEEETIRRECELIEQNKTLLLQLRQRINQIKVLQKQWEEERINSTSQAKELRSYNQQLQQETSQLRTMMSVPAVTSLQTTQADLEKAKTEAKSAQQRQQQQQEQIQKLNQQLQVLQNKLAETKQQGASFKSLQLQIGKITTAKSLAESELQSLRNSEHNYRETIASLENQLASQHQVQAQLKRQLEIMQRTLTESQQREQESHHKAQTANQQIAILIEEIERHEEDMGRHPLNNFERAVLTCLQNSLPQREIITQYDAGNGGDNSKFIDFLIVMNNCIIALEAKSYKGRIEPIGDPRNTNWRCQIGNGKILINSCWGRNPYQQVKTYTDALLARIRNSHNTQHSRIPVYGVVVFPAEASITSDITSNIGGYFRVTTINNLIETIKNVDIKAQTINSTQMN